MKHIANLFLISILFCSCKPNGQKEMNFDLSAENDKTFRVHISRETTKTFGTNSTGDTLSMEIEIHSLPKKDSLSVMQVTLNGIRVNLPNGFMKINNQLVKESDINAIRDSLLAASKGLSVNAIVNEKGMTERIENMDELFKTLANRTGKSKPEVKYWLTDYISEDAIKDILNRLFSVVASKTVTPGQNWGSTITLRTKAPININSLYTLTNLHADSAFVDIQSTMIAGTAGNFYLNGEQTGTVVLNYKSGMPYKYETSWQTVTKTSSYDVHETERFVAIFER